jgi:hypothetical protein
MHKGAIRHDITSRVPGRADERSALGTDRWPDRAFSSVKAIEKRVAEAQRGRGISNKHYSSDCNKRFFASPRIPSLGDAKPIHPLSPGMREELYLNYQNPILARFGLVGYGCCENLAHKIDGVLSQTTDLGRAS